MFQNRRLLIATKHKKDSVLAPLLEENLGVNCVVATAFDTDVFGTFTGELERKEDPVKTVRKKCLEAMAMYDCDLGIASEGSFGSHPLIPFVPANEEIVIFIDRKNDLEIISKEIGMETNFSAEKVNTWEELVDFAGRALFPSHALILRMSERSHSLIFKGITDWDLLKSSYEELQKDSSAVWVETDMRALHNPTRMEMIKKTGLSLIEKIKSCCPHCNSPGFSVTRSKSGLSCSLCGSATRSTLSHLYECQKCSFKTEEEYPYGKYSENPEFCDICNP